MLFCYEGTEVVLYLDNGLSSSVVVPEGVYDIGQYAFANCNGIESISLPSSLYYIGSGAFEDCDSLTELNIPDSVRLIENRAFYGCFSLREVKMGNGIQKFGSDLFMYCQNLEQVTLPDTLLEISDSLFYGCYKLKSVSVGSKTKVIDTKAFETCTSMESILVNDDNPYYSSNDGILFNKEQTKLIYFPSAKSTTYEISDTVTVIGENAFSGCNSIQEITIPASVNKIDLSAMNNMRGLRYIDVAPANREYSSIDGILYNKEQTTTLLCPYAWENSTYLTPETVTTIGEGAFPGDVLICFELTEGVTTIKKNAFSNCPHLATITLPESLTTLEDSCFYVPRSSSSGNNLGIQAVYYKGTTKQWNDLLSSPLNCMGDELANVADIHCTRITPDPIEIKPIVKGEVTVASEWDTGYNVNFTVTNNSEKAVDNWKVIFTSNDSISNIWCAQVLSHLDDSYEIGNADWNGTIEPGKSVTFGFIMDKSSAKASTPDNISVIVAD